jgi:hypothetical protein
MSITIRLNHVLQPYAGGRETVEVKGRNVKECLDNLVIDFPVFHDILFDTTNSPAVLVLYDGETIVPKDLNRPVIDRSEIIIQPMLQGG